MIKSMTGFGRSTLKSGQATIHVEIKTINHKYFDLSPRLPGFLSEYEESFRKVVANEIKRGKIYLNISAPDPSALSSRLILNEQLAKEVHHQIKNLRTILQFKTRPHDHEEKAHEEAIILREVLRYPDVLSKDTSYDRSEGLVKQVEQGIKLALKKLNDSRVREGKALDKDFKNRLLEISKSLNVVIKRVPQLGKEYRATLHAKMKEFVKDGEIEKERLTIEVAQYVKNSDISEETVRMKSHIDTMGKTLKETGELGRKIDFIAQEMYREANTMGAKSNDPAIAEAVIHIKGAIEKIREQAQNIE